MANGMKWTWKKSRNWDFPIGWPVPTESEEIREALDQGASGVQIGTPFAFCEESGLKPEIKQEILRKIVDGNARVFTDPLASPTGFPFKVFVGRFPFQSGSLRATSPVMRSRLFADAL